MRMISMVPILSEPWKDCPQYVMESPNTSVDDIRTTIKILKVPAMLLALASKLMLTVVCASTSTLAVCS